VECLSWREGTLLGSPDACPDVQTEGKCWVPVGRVRLTGPATPVTVGWRGSVQTSSRGDGVPARPSSLAGVTIAEFA
jgi:hypothetical protein